MFYKGFAFDAILAALALGVGIFSVIKPVSAWNLLQSKKVKEKIEATDRTYKSTRIMGFALFAIAILFIFVSVIPNITN